MKGMVAWGPSQAGELHPPHPPKSSISSSWFALWFASSVSCSCGEARWEASPEADRAGPGRLCLAVSGPCCCCCCCC